MPTEVVDISPVPYYSQWESPGLVPDIIAGTMSAAEDPLWQKSGATSPEEYEYWSWRLCGMACLRMVLDHWRSVAPALVHLAQECLEAGAYVRRGDGRLDGLIYAPFATYARLRWDLHAESCPDLRTGDVADSLAADRLVLLSVHPSIRTLAPDPPRKGGHLVLAVAADDTNIYLHNPSGLPGQSQRGAVVAWPDLDRFYAGRGVVLANSS